MAAVNTQSTLTSDAGGVSSTDSGMFLGLQRQRHTRQSPGTDGCAHLTLEKDVHNKLREVKGVDKFINDDLKVQLVRGAESPQGAALFTFSHGDANESRRMHLEIWLQSAQSAQAWPSFPVAALGIALASDGEHTGGSATVTWRLTSVQRNILHRVCHLFPECAFEPDEGEASREDHMKPGAHQAAAARVIVEAVAKAIAEMNRQIKQEVPAEPLRLVMWRYEVDDRTKRTNSGHKTPNRKVAVDPVRRDYYVEEDDDRTIDSWSHLDSTPWDGDTTPKDSEALWDAVWNQDLDKVHEALQEIGKRTDDQRHCRILDHRRRFMVAGNPKALTGGVLLLAILRLEGAIDLCLANQDSSQDCKQQHATKEILKRLLDANADPDATYDCFPCGQDGTFLMHALLKRPPAPYEIFKQSAAGQTRMKQALLAGRKDPNLIHNAGAVLTAPLCMAAKSKDTLNILAGSTKRLGATATFNYYKHGNVVFQAAWTRNGDMMRCLMEIDDTQGSLKQDWKTSTEGWHPDHPPGSKDASKHFSTAVGIAIKNNMECAEDLLNRGCTTAIREQEFHGLLPQAHPERFKCVFAAMAGHSPGILLSIPRDSIEHSHPKLLERVWDDLKYSNKAMKLKAEVKEIMWNSQESRMKFIESTLDMIEERSPAISVVPSLRSPAVSRRLSMRSKMFSKSTLDERVFSQHRFQRNRLLMLRESQDEETRSKAAKHLLNLDRQIASDTMVMTLLEHAPKAATILLDNFFLQEPEIAVAHRNPVASQAVFHGGLGLNTTYVHHQKWTFDPTCDIKWQEQLVNPQGWCKRLKYMHQSIQRLLGSWCPYGKTESKQFCDVRVVHIGGLLKLDVFLAIQKLTYEQQVELFSECLTLKAVVAQTWWRLAEAYQWLQLVEDMVQFVAILVWSINRERNRIVHQVSWVMFGSIAFARGTYDVAMLLLVISLNLWYRGLLQVTRPTGREIGGWFVHAMSLPLSIEGWVGSDSERLFISSYWYSFSCGVMLTLKSAMVLDRLCVHWEIGRLLIPIIDACWDPRMYIMFIVLLFSFFVAASFNFGVWYGARQDSFKNATWASWINLVVGEPTILDVDHFEQGWDQYWVVSIFHFAIGIILMNILLAITMKTYEKMSESVDGRIYRRLSGLCFQLFKQRRRFFIPYCRIQSKLPEVPLQGKLGIFTILVLGSSVAVAVTEVNLWVCLLFLLAIIQLVVRLKLVFRQPPLMHVEYDNKTRHVEVDFTDTRCLWICRPQELQAKHNGTLERDLDNARSRVRQLVEELAKCKEQLNAVQPRHLS